MERQGDRFVGDSPNRFLMEWATFVLQGDTKVGAIVFFSFLLGDPFFFKKKKEIDRQAFALARPNFFFVGSLGGSLRGWTVSCTQKKPQKRAQRKQRITCMLREVFYPMTFYRYENVFFSLADSTAA